MVSFSQNFFSKHNTIRKMAVRALPPRDLPDAGFQSLLWAQKLGRKRTKTILGLSLEGYRAKLKGVLGLFELMFFLHMRLMRKTVKEISWGLMPQDFRSNQGQGLLRWEIKLNTQKMITVQLMRWWTFSHQQAQCFLSAHESLYLGRL